MHVCLCKYSHVPHPNPHTIQIDKTGKKVIFDSCQNSRDEKRFCTLNFIVPMLVAPDFGNLPRPQLVFQGACTLSVVFMSVSQPNPIHTWQASSRMVKILGLRRSVSNGTNEWMWYSRKKPGLTVKQT